MQIFTKISEIQNYLKQQKGKIGFVPTMGALHAGHLSLVKASQKKCDITVVSIFVNPTQFAPNEDLEKYPQPIENDKKILEQEKVDILFLPKIEEIYPNEKKPKIPELPSFTKILEGASRPTHFLGVAQVVKRFFEIIKPTEVFFGQKDFQQTLVIKWLIDTYFPEIKLNICPIIREEDGLALSSRNQYLNEEERKGALVLNKTLKLTQELIQNGEKNIKIIENKMREYIVQEPLAKIDYAVIRDKKDLNSQTDINPDSVILIAVKIGNTRLIDNLSIF